MIDVTARFTLWELPTLLMPPDALADKWDKYAHPAQADKAVFHFKESDGDMELVINHQWSVTITVRGAVDEEVIREPNPEDKNHQQAVASFYQRAFTLLNHFIQRYRFNTFNYRTHPIKWQVRLAPANAKAPLPSEFVVETPIKWKIDFDVDIDEDIDLPAALNFKIRQDRSDQWVSYSYPVHTLEKTYDEVSALVEGERKKPQRQESVDPKGQNAYEIAIELLMQAQELVVSEHKQRQEERSALVCCFLNHNSFRLRSLCERVRSNVWQRFAQILDQR